MVTVAMTATEARIVLGVLAGWVLVGLATALVMRRRGHHLGAWTALGVFFGPLTVALAVHHSRLRPTPSPRPTPRPRRRHAVSVLVGLDGSPESIAALRAATNLLGSRIGRLTLASVIDYDTAGSSEDWEERRRAEAWLREGARSVEKLRPDTLVLAGPPAEALKGCAEEGGYDLLVIGCRGGGRSKALLGSVASTLARGSPVPVLMSSCSDEPTDATITG